MKLDDVILALEMTNDLSHAFYDLVTREIVWLDEYGLTREEYEATADTLDEHGFHRLPDQREINEYGMMEAFAEAHNSSELSYALLRKGAFRRFKDTVRHLGIEEEWYRFRDAEYMRVAQEWCEICGIELDSE